MSATTFLYCLTDPGSRIPRYFGKTDDPKRRRRGHILEANKGENVHVYCWIRKLLKAGQRPDLHVLCEVPKEDFARFERAFIAIGRQHGLPLTNITDGGEGVAGLKGRTPWNKGRKGSCPWNKGIKGSVPWNRGRKSPETSGTNHHTFGKPLSAATRARMSQAAKGRPAWNKGQKTDTTTLDKLSAIRVRSKQARAKSKFIGVYWDKGWPGWVVRLRVSGKYVYVGSFKDEILAAKASDAAAKKYFGANTKLNFPD